MNSFTRKNNTRLYRLPLVVFVIIAGILGFIQFRLPHLQLLLAERFTKGVGWIEVFVVAGYGAIVMYHMQDPLRTPGWRKMTWFVFTVVFFGQLLLGLTLNGKFLMTGKLHVPVPALIIAGPLYRGQLSIMTILFLSTILITGSAWCSQLCYFGAMDNLMAGRKKSVKTIQNKGALKATFFMFVVVAALTMRWLHISSVIATFLAVGFGAAGLLIMVLLSAKKGKMYHCIIYCPVGTFVNYLRYINPFRIKIDHSCTNCMRCIPYCKYDALGIQDVRNKKPGITCTLCGDCIAGCRDNSIHYQFFKINPVQSRNLYMVLVVSLHAIFMALARI